MAILLVADRAHKRTLSRVSCTPPIVSPRCHVVAHIMVRVRSLRRRAQQTETHARRRARARDDKFRDPAHVTGSKHEITNLELVNTEGRFVLIITLIRLCARALIITVICDTRARMLMIPCVCVPRPRCLSLTDIIHIWYIAAYTEYYIELYHLSCFAIIYARHISI